MITSDALKVEAICWLRYGKRMNVVCTEVGRWHADVLGLCDKMSIEVEVKISKADLMREFTHKKMKVWMYANAKDTDRFIPNYFYYLLPEALGEAACTILSEKAPKAGVAAFTETSFLAGNNIKILKKAVKLRAGPPSSQLLRMAMARMSSELCGSKQVILKLKNQIIKSFDDMTYSAVAIAAGAVVALDCEDKELDLEDRAAHLAQCVEGKNWEDVADKDKWRAATLKLLAQQPNKGPCNEKDCY